MSRKKTTLIVVHTTATPYRKNYTIGQIRAMHKARGFKDVGYHYVIDQKGKRMVGRPVNNPGAHVRGYNSISVGVSYVGGLGKNGKAQNTMNEAQEKAMIKLLGELQKKYPKALICGHRDLSKDIDGDGYIEPHEWIKECPCFDAIPWAENNNFKVANIKGAWTEGDTGPVVEPDADEQRNEYLQKLLKMHGFEFGAIDGIVGNNTKAAIVRFQKSVGLDPTGEFDIATVFELRKIEKTLEKEVVVRKIDEVKVPVQKTGTIVALIMAIIAAVAGWAGLDYDDVTDAVKTEISNEK